MASVPEIIERGARFDQSKRYRYRLWRRWDLTLPAVAFVMLNPSTADAEHDDPTIRRCFGFARSWGFGALEVVNLFAWRSTSPAALQSAKDPVGPANDAAILDAHACCGQTVLAWGNHGAHLNRDREVRLLLDGDASVVHFGLTGAGQPRHPLYIRADAPRLSATAMLRPALV